VSKVALGLALGVLFLFTYLLGVRPAYALAYALGLLFVISWAWPRLVIRGITLARHLDPGIPTVGEPFEETFTVRKKGWVPAPWLEVRDLGQLSDYQPGRVFSVGGESVTWRARGVYRKRGWMTFGPTSIRVQEPFGLFSQEARLRDRTTILVYPRVRPIPDLLASSAQQIGVSPSFGAWADYPPETGGVRDYTSGDSFGRIHWPLSAHHNRLMSKTFEQPLTTDIWILLDLDRKVHFGEGEESTVEYLTGLQSRAPGRIDRQRRARHIPRAAPGAASGPAHPRLPRHRAGGRQYVVVSGARLGSHAQAAQARDRCDHAQRGTQLGPHPPGGARPPDHTHRLLRRPRKLWRTGQQSQLRPRTGRRPVCRPQRR